MADRVSPWWTGWLFCGVFAATLRLELTAETLIGLLGIRGSEAELPPGLELPRISALAYGAGHTGRALPRVAPGLRLDVGGQGPASVPDCMSTDPESPPPAQREQDPDGALRLRESNDARLSRLTDRSREQRRHGAARHS